MTSSTPTSTAISDAEIDARTRIILEAPLLRTIIRLAVPNAAVMATQVSLGLIELYFLAKLGVDALAGVSQVFPLVSLVGAISQGAIGGGVLSAVARRLGKTERSEADEMVWYAIAIAVAMGALPRRQFSAEVPHTIRPWARGERRSTPQSPIPIWHSHSPP
jgi:MATE family, multidrug efflux pump